MKKITLLFLLLFSLISYHSTAQSYKYHRFYSIVNGTPITKQFAKDNCGKTYSFQQLGDRNYVNIQIETPLSYKKFYLLNFGDGLKYYYLYTSSSNTHNDEDYSLSIPYTITSICTPLDSDGDSVPDSTDNCPSTPNTNQLDTDNDGIGDECDNSISQPMTYKSHTFYSILNGSTITNQIALNNCGLTFSTSKLRGRNYVNIQTNTPLEPGKFYYLNFGRGLNYYYLWQSNSGEHNDEDYRIDYHTEITIQTCSDSDNDGVPNAIDNCPNQAGPSSNNGCPIPTGNPDLIIDSSQTFIFSDCFNCSSQLSSLGSRRHEINNQSGILNISTLSVKNIGNRLSSGTDIQYYVSSNTTLDTSDFKSTSPATSLGSINSGQNLIKSKSLFISDFGSPGRFYGSWYILMVVDDSKSNDESNEKNNVTAIPVTFTDPFGKSSRSASRSINLTTKLSLGQLSENKSYPIEIYNFQGQKVLSKGVLSIEEENQASLELPRGFYIIKSENGDRKVYID